MDYQSPDWPLSCTCDLKRRYKYSCMHLHSTDLDNEINLYYAIVIMWWPINNRLRKLCSSTRTLTYTNHGHLHVSRTILWWTRHDHGLRIYFRIPATEHHQYQGSQRRFALSLSLSPVLRDGHGWFFLWIWSWCVWKSIEDVLTCYRTSSCIMFVICRAYRCLNRVCVDVDWR